MFLSVDIPSARAWLVRKLKWVRDICPLDQLPAPYILLTCFCHQFVKNTRLEFLPIGYTSQLVLQVWGCERTSSCNNIYNDFINGRSCFEGAMVRIFLILRNRPSMPTKPKLFRQEQISSVVLWSWLSIHSLWSCHPVVWSILLLFPPIWSTASFLPGQFVDLSRFVFQGESKLTIARRRHRWR